MKMRQSIAQLEQAFLEEARPTASVARRCAACRAPSVSATSSAAHRRLLRFFVSCSRCIATAVGVTV